MSGAHREAVAAAFGALRIESPTSFSWCGEATPPLPAETVERMGAEAARAFLRDRLRDRLYVCFYCSGRPVPRPSQQGSGALHRPSAFAESLSRVNHGVGGREGGWTVVGVEADGRIVVHRHGLSLWARPDEVLGADLEPGAEVSVRLPPELLRLSPGFYMALGNEELDGEEAVVRHYWHLSSSGGAALVEAATRLLNDAGLPFRLKVLIEPDLYVRCDAGVLYTPERCREQVAGLVPLLRDEVAAHLKPGTPALTEPLGEGLAVAEDPQGEDSFGMDRCGLLAEAMLRAFERGAESSEERLAVAAGTFAERGVDLDRPHLNPGSAYEYGLAG